MDLRCGHVKHAELVTPGVVEFKCRSRYCGAGPGVIVLHRFDAMTGRLLGTRRFKQPTEPKRTEHAHAAANSAPVRPT